MSRLYVGAAAMVLASVIGGTALYTTLTASPECGGNSIAGGNAAIGGPFELLLPDETLVTEREVIDRPTLVYFGYTFCPDVCPFDVARNMIAIDILGEQGIDVKPVFVTIDPERDTPEIMGQYAEDMHPRMVALTGSDEQIRDAAQAYRVYYARGAGEGEFYLMDHSTFSYLMMPDGTLATYFGRSASPEEIADETSCLLSA